MGAAERPPAGEAPVAITHYAFLDVAGGGAGRWLGEGWRVAERLAWTTGAGSTLRLPAPADAAPRVLDLDVVPWRHAHGAAQTLGIQVNGRDLGEVLLTRRCLVRCRLEPALWQGREFLEIALAHPHFVVPRLMAAGPEAWPVAVGLLGVGLAALHVGERVLHLPVLPPAGPDVKLPTLPQESTAPAAPPASYRFGIGRPASELAGEGWAPPEQDGQWTEGRFARLTLPSPAAGGGYALRLELTPLTAPGICPAQDVTVLAGGLVLGHLRIAGPGAIALPLPTALTRAAAPLEIGLHIPTAARPAELGLGSDWRELGLFLRLAAVEPLPPALAVLAGRRVDEVLPLPAAETADRFCETPAGELAQAVQTALGLPAEAVLRDFSPFGGSAPGRVAVLGRPAPPTLAEALAAAIAATRQTSKMLLYIVGGAPESRHGAVERLAPGLLRGHLAAPPGEGGVAPADWLRLCANAATLLDAPQRPAGPPPPPVEQRAEPRVEPLPEPPPAPPRAEPLPELPPATLRGFESLGDSGELGRVLRAAGQASLGLFCEADVPLRGLLNGFGEEFVAIEARDGIAFNATGGALPTYMLAVPRYGMRWPTGVAAEPGTDAAAACAPHVVRLRYLRRKFLDGLRGAGRVCVLRRDAALSLEEVAPVAAALRRHGQHTLLYVAAGGSAPTVVEETPGVLRGTLPHLAPAVNPDAADVSAWLELLRQAWALHAAAEATV